jgi:hypothetical protein
MPPLTPKAVAVTAVALNPTRITATVDVGRARVGLQLDGFTDAETTVYRVIAGVRTVVRALNPARPISGTAFAYDYEAPVNQALRYEAANGALTVTSATVTVATSKQWLKAPASPAVNITGRLARVPQLNRPRNQDIVRVIGRRNAVVISDVRGGASGTLEFVTLTEAEADDFDTFLDGADVAYISLPGSRFGERYVQLGDAQAEPVSPKLNEPGLRWSVPYVEIDRPVSAAVGDLTGSYELLASSFASYTTAKAAHTSYLDMLNGLNVA